MKKILVVVLVVAIALVGASIAMAGVAGSKHDITNYLWTGGTVSHVGGLDTLVSREVCVYCHTPHGGVGTAGLLWNKQETAVTLGTPYSMVSATGGGQAMTTLSTITKLCLSCHDGIQAVYYMKNTPNYGAFITATTGTANVDAGGLIINAAKFTGDFSDDHPVGFNYDTAQSAENILRPGSLPVTPPATLPLSNGNMMECSTCHDVHNSVAVANSALLRVDNALSGLCTSCHINK